MSVIQHAYTLLHAEKPGNEGAELVRCHPPSVFNSRKTFVTHGLDAALHRKIRDETLIPRKLDGAGEACHIQIACSEPPEGRSRWTLQLLADRLMELQVADAISIKTMERTLKNELHLHTKKQGVIPPHENGNFVAATEYVLAVYQRPFDPEHPVICMDEQPIQPHAEVREPIPTQLGRPERHEYERTGLSAGSCSPSCWGSSGGTPSRKPELRRIGLIRCNTFSPWTIPTQRR